MENLSNIKVKILDKEIASVTIDESKTYNALSFRNLGDLIKALKKLDNDKNIKVIIIEAISLSKILTLILLKLSIFSHFSSNFSSRDFLYFFR